MSAVLEGPQISNALVGKPSFQPSAVMAEWKSEWMVATSSSTKCSEGTKDINRGSAALGHKIRLPISEMALRASVSEASISSNKTSRQDSIDSVYRINFKF